MVEDLAADAHEGRCKSGSIKTEEKQMKQQQTKYEHEIKKAAELSEQLQTEIIALK